MNEFIAEFNKHRETRIKLEKRIEQLEEILREAIPYIQEHEIWRRAQQVLNKL